MFCISPLPEYFQELIAVQVWHLDIANDQVREVTFQPFQCFETIVFANDLIVSGEKVFQKHADAGFIINDEYFMVHIRFKYFRGKFSTIANVIFLNLYLSGLSKCQDVERNKMRFNQGSIQRTELPVPYSLFSQSSLPGSRTH